MAHILDCREAPLKTSEAISLQLLINKANARWLEKHVAIGNAWHPPRVVDAKALKLKGVDMDMYEQVRGVIQILS